MLVHMPPEGRPLQLLRYIPIAVLFISGGRSSYGARGIWYHVRDDYPGMVAGGCSLTKNAPGLADVVRAQSGKAAPVEIKSIEHRRRDDGGRNPAGR